MDTEELLTTQWLNARESYDSIARDVYLLREALGLLPRDGSASIADLGSGTGNNVFFLLNHLQSPTHIFIVEQHPYLNAECRRRVTETFNMKMSDENLLLIELNDHVHTLEFIQMNLFDWLSMDRNVDLYTSSALLDLLTLTELQFICAKAKRSRTPYYATLNYTGVEFSPSSDHDKRFVAMFESHMSRSLDRGKPLGANTITQLVNHCSPNNYLPLKLSKSFWEIPSSDQAFIRQNLAFYREAIETTTGNDPDRSDFDDWWNRKKLLVDNKNISLTVKHQDALITPL